MLRRRLFTLMLTVMVACLAMAQDVNYTRYSNLPTIYIETFNKVAITSKNTYVYATMYYVDENDVVTQYDSMQIRGRGNSTWGLSKKPYRIKFNQKEKFLGKGYAKAKSWTLLANAGDKTLMRNAVTSAMGEFMGMRFNPAYKFVDVCLNGLFIGNYQISDQVEVRAHRVNIIEQDYPLNDWSDITGGYLLEVDGFKHGNCFTTSKGQVPIRIHYPDEDEIASNQNEYIRNYMKNFEAALFGSDFADADKGYRRWVDSLSLVNWFIGTEVSANIDGYYSTYFYKNQDDSLLYWGPMWDYDIAYDNDYRISGNVKKLMTDVGYGQTKVWVNKMWEDPWFARLVNRRYEELLDNGMVEYMLQTIDSISDLLQESQRINYHKWGIGTRMYHEVVLYSSYDQYVTDLKNFITQHTDYLYTAFASKKPAEPTPPFSPSNYYYRILNVKSQKALDVIDQSMDAGANVCIWTDSETRLSGDWQIRPIGEYFHLTNRHNELALNDPTEGAVTPTTNVGTQLNVVESDTLDDRQLWLITPQGTNGEYNLTNKYTQHTANVSGGGTTDGTKIVSYITDDRNGVSQNRLWTFVRSAALPEPEIPVIPDTVPTDTVPTDTVPTDTIPNAIDSIEPAEYALAYNTDMQILHFGSETPEQLTFMVAVYSVGGQKVKTFRADEHCSVADLADGVYIVTWRCGGHIRSTKFRKE